MVRFLSLAAKCLSIFLTASSVVDAASLQQVSNFGTNPTGVQMFIYVPDRVATRPAILVAMHYCTGTAQAYFSGTGYRGLADTHGFIVIYPDAPDSGGCWDVHSANTLKHDAGGDSLGIASMVRYTIRQYNADPNRVYATGTSSGAMMTQVLAGAYPDMFQAGAAVAGVPYSCFAGSSMWNSQCAQGQISRTGQQWGDLVRQGYPGYTGRRPRIQLWHGTNDETLNYNNHKEAIKQWANVLGVSETPTSSQSNSPASGWTRQKFGTAGTLEALNQQGGSHNIQVFAQEIVNFLGILTAPPSQTTSTPITTPTGPPTTTSVPPPVTTTTSSPGGTVPKWGQCGGIGYTGPTTCAAGSTCKVANPYYSQCL